MVFQAETLSRGIMAFFAVQIISFLSEKKPVKG
jgi:hypothetical protein